LWSVLVDGQCTVTQIPHDRFPLARFGHVRRQERGKSYTWAAGVLDDVFSFDPSVFGISPREATQMDPQQRLLLELTWEAFEDAGIRPSSIAGKNVGVYVGASLTDYGNILSSDPALADAQFATGNALAILSNRISYVFDLHGPSLTIDTACSSSLVALHEASEALRSGRIDTAIVGGVNIIASPAAFISFSQASMLSPTGRCRAFSADADGFVRAEGGAVLVLRKAALAQIEKNPVRGTVVASDVNSDGRTSGILLPSRAAQEELIGKVYARANISASSLAFVEAHGTGTPVGDPIEARAIGNALGRFRQKELPIGSVKTNIGHLEPASGLAGVIKSLLALNFGILPQSLHFTSPNPKIDFEGLGLRPAGQPILLPQAAEQYAGVNSFGFGGTNAHVVLAGGRPASSAHVEEASYFFMSAKSQPALQEMARDYRARTSNLSAEDIRRTASVAAHRRDHLEQRLILPLASRKEFLNGLDAFIGQEVSESYVAGEAVTQNMPIAFVYSGNGGQWPGMGVSALRHSASFRRILDEIDQQFLPLAGWSLRQTLESDDIASSLEYTQIAQPLIFSIQVALTYVLREMGVLPSVVLGHSVGEVAAAYAAGALDLSTAIKVIHYRSKHQELFRDRGRMAALAASPEQALELIDSIEGVEIAALNSPRSVTIAGAVEALERVRIRARSETVAMLDIGLSYPFHTAMMSEIRSALLDDLKDTKSSDGPIPFISTVTGKALPGGRLDGTYWWRNVREPVRFSDAVQKAARDGARCFVEIGPRSVLTKHVSDILKDHEDPTFTCGTLERDDFSRDPIPQIFSKILVAGGKVEFNQVFGRDPGPAMPLPHYPWQRQHFRFGATVEAHGGFEPRRSRYAGARYSVHDLEWHSHIDASVMPELRDHRVGEQTIFPGTGFLDIALSVAREWLQSDCVTIADFEILKPLDLSSDETRHVITRISPASSTFEILSRSRLAEGDWLLNVRGKIIHGSAPSQGPDLGDLVPKEAATIDGSEIYRLSERHSLHYGPAFRQVRQVRRFQDYLTVELNALEILPDLSLDPLALDACAHAIFPIFVDLDAEQRGVTYIPVRIDEVALFHAGATISRADVHVVTKNERSILANYSIYGLNGELIAVLKGVRGQAIPVRRSVILEANAVIEACQLIDGAATGGTGVGFISTPERQADDDPNMPRADLTFDGWALAVAAEVLSAVSEDGIVDPARILREARWPQESFDLLTTLLDRLLSMGLAQRGDDDGGTTLIVDPAMPSAASMLQLLYDEQPDRAADLLIAGEITAWLDHVKAEGRVTEATPVSATSIDFHDASGGSARARTRLLVNILEDDLPWPSDRALRVLHLGYHAGTPELAAALQRHEAIQVILEPDAGRSGEAALHGLSGAALVQTLSDAEFDLIVSVEGLARHSDFAGLHAALAPGGSLLAIEAQPSLYDDLVVGLSSSANWRLRRSGQQWTDLLQAAQFGVIRTTLKGASQVISAGSSKTMDVPVANKARYRIVGTGFEPDVADRVSHALTPWKRDGEDNEAFIWLMPKVEHLAAVGDLADACMNLKAFAEERGGRDTSVWIVFSGGEVQPFNRALWAYTRVLANEHANLKVRRVALSQKPSAADFQLLARLITSNTDEIDIEVAHGAVRAIRVQPLSYPTDRPGTDVARLQRRQDLSDRVRWMPSSRIEPSDREVEIAVEATGLNFRDVMWMLGLLPDDILEDGFAGPTLGLECAGRVVRCGAGVQEFKPGDRVVGFIPSAFSTHVTVDVGHVMTVPDNLSAAAAATIPVAFLTAYYGLVTLARLRAGEWVLIHSAAGAVGLAAIQVAQARRAKIIVSAGSQAKRGLLRSLGIEHVLDSRSLSFVDEIRRIRPEGVDVVLNSLAGEAMERSLACVKSFGRFIELGKRDYVSNTHIGLRPFRKNISYFGVDVDQLVGRRAAVGRKSFETIMRQFSLGTYRPLPHSVFPASDTVKAFNTMQKASHIGKIVVQPPQQVAQSETELVIAPDRTHLVTGGLGGFGLATARWLVNRGARNLVLLSRSGPTTEEAQDALRQFDEIGVRVLAVSCDVSDKAALQQLLLRVKSEMPPLAGVMHAAMVLDDGLLGNLDHDRFVKVLQPKVAGANHLHELTRDTPLDYFVLFSSVTTIFGNPGQANYVAANGYLEGLARYRRSKGLPGLAVGFGPIADVGVVTRSRMLQENLRTISGARGMKSQDALDLLGQAMRRFHSDPEQAVVTIAPNDAGFALERLPILSSPTYATWVSRRSSASEAATLDLRALVQEKDIEEVRELVAAAVVTQVARVLRAREETLQRTRLLAEMGLDSLMALELGLNLEKAFGIEIPLTVSAADLTIAKLVDRIIAQAGGRSEPDDRAGAMAAPHLPNADSEQIDAIQAMIGGRAG
jgi:acyl transferase domain-containing protein/NADPH:quinone reductase-like Zn-dependent oxidoreductase/NAD(P)-dependent dehydrogenase (short-subunit alcohol dehydrogenase family)/acyl carrier protein